MVTVRKSQPNNQQVHVNKPLTNISIAYMQNETNYIADQIFPRVPVTKQSDKYFVFDKGDWFRDEAKLRGPSQESAGSGYNVSTESYFCDVWALHKDIADQIRANEDNPLNSDRNATQFVTGRLLLSRERKFVDNYMSTGVWDHEMEGGASGGSGDFVHWDDYDNSDPIEDVEDGIEEIEGVTGFRPNVMAMGSEVWRALKNHPDILERYKYTQRGVITPDLIAPIFGIDRIHIARGVHNKAAEGLDDDFEYIHPDSVLLAYANPQPAIEMPSAGYTFTWTGYGGSNAYGVTISTFRMEKLKSDRVEGELAYDQKVVAEDLGCLLHSVTS